jgi:uridine monophosphate synthetase
MADINSFIHKLSTSVAQNNSLLCVGIDPDLSKVPAGSLPEGSIQDQLIAFSTRIINATADLVCCYKPNAAFFEQYGPEGVEALKAVIAAIPDTIPVLLDCKRGDIGNTAKAYAKAAFEVLNADGATISPYLGKDSVSPFIDTLGKFAFLLCNTSNPSAAEIQNFGGQPLFHHIARQGQLWGTTDQIGFVVGATRPESLEQVRAIAPDSWILAPGVGAQGGDLQAALKAGLRADGLGLIVPVSRAVIFADDPHQAAIELRDQINAQRELVISQSNEAGLSITKAALVKGLYEAGCVKFGDFTLASGKKSPIYVDLRRVISYPQVFSQVVQAYIQLMNGVQFDLIAGVPYAAIAAAGAVAHKTQQPMIFPRKEVKAHGTGQQIEGNYETGQTALAIEDVITSGGSLLKAIETMTLGGLQIKDVLVLVDREQGGRDALAAEGIQLHAVVTISEILESLKTQGLIETDMYQTVKTYLEG